MKCAKCNIDKNIDQFYTVKSGPRKGKVQSYCKPCNHSNTLERQRAFKSQCVEYKGGKCIRCGYDKCQAVLEFHHRNPKLKDFTIGRIKHTSFEKNKSIKEELDKCDLLCKNCHYEAHYYHGDGLQQL